MAKAKSGFYEVHMYLQMLVHVSTCAHSCIITSYLASVSIILQFSQAFINIHIWDCILKCTCKVVQTKLRTHMCKSVWYYCRYVRILSMEACRWNCVHFTSSTVQYLCGVASCEHDWTTRSFTKKGKTLTRGCSSVIRWKRPPSNCWG